MYSARSTIRVISGLIAIFVIVVQVACDTSAYIKNKSHQNIPDSSIARGEQLAKMYCRSCHLLPDPSLLSSNKWETGVLPQMGPRLGIFNYGFLSYSSKRGDPNIGPSFYPAKPVISYVDWQHIIDYYTSLSPDTLIASEKDSTLIPAAGRFTPLRGTASHNAVTGFVYGDTESLTRHIITADMETGIMRSLNNKGDAQDSIRFASPAVNAVLCGDTLISVNIGISDPNDVQTGSIQQIQYINGRFTSKPVVLDSGLRRPVHIDVMDINGDGRKDILVCEFGNLKGALSWLENKGGNQYEHHIIRNQPGAIAIVVTDFNGDGLPDFYVLFSQGDEQIGRFENKGNGHFEYKQLLRFPPVYGSSYFEMKDMNHDGKEDIIYTCGDNADYSIELKPYHGVYIFTNDGQDHFTQQYFFHINGCFKAMARDFDGDGDNDIAAISFFADYKNRPDEGFVYLENKSRFHFIPYSVPAAKQGRWLSMDVKDTDGDGKPDIILGNFSYPTFIPSAVNWKEKPALLVLKNNMP